VEDTNLSHHLGQIQALLLSEAKSSSGDVSESSTLALVTPPPNYRARHRKSSKHWSSCLHFFAKERVSDRMVELSVLDVCADVCE
jgi:hypothetical protein